MLALNVDEWLAKAGKIRSDLPKIIERHPREYAVLLHSLRNFGESDFRVLVGGLAQQFDVIIGNPPFAHVEARKEKVHAHLPIDWELLKKTFQPEPAADAGASKPTRARVSERTPSKSPIRSDGSLRRG